MAGLVAPEAGCYSTRRARAMPSHGTGRGGGRGPKRAEWFELLNTLSTGLIPT